MPNRPSDKESDRLLGISDIESIISEAYSSYNLFLLYRLYSQKIIAVPNFPLKSPILSNVLTLNNAYRNKSIELESYFKKKAFHVSDKFN